jgi:hypothetical protein
LHRGESGAFFAIAPRPAHFDKTKHNADEHGHRRCDICDCSQIHDDNLRKREKIKSRRINFDPAAFELLTNRCLLHRS